ncbi:MAG: ABC transporter permease [Parvularculales bacterium]
MTDITRVREYPAEGVRHFGAVNWLGLWTLYLKEVQRFFKILTQTVMAPVITTLLFLAVFSLALGGLRPDISGVPFSSFLAPGLIMMATIQNAFANTGSSLLIAKIQGTEVDFLMPPLSAGELNLGFALGGVTRGLLVAIMTGLGITFFVEVDVKHWWAVVYFAVNASLTMSLMGIITGIWSQKFDHMQAITNFVVVPLSFLSGTFYSVRQLPELAYNITHVNPFFYMIDGFRYGFTGHSDGSLLAGVLFLGGLNIILWTVCHWIFRTGWRLKS